MRLRRAVQCHNDTSLATGAGSIANRSESRRLLLHGPLIKQKLTQFQPRPARIGDGEIGPSPQGLRIEIFPELEWRW